MRIKGIFLVAFLALCSSLLVKAQTLLTAKPWHLYQKRQGEKKTLLHKPSDANFVFIFYADGKLLYRRNHGKEDLDYTWKWKDASHKKIIVKRNSDSLGALFHIKELSSTRLVWYVADAKGKNIYEFTFRHADEVAWLKEDIDGKNAARKDSVLREKTGPTP